MTKLTPKQAAFAAEYIIDLNGTQAAIRAGFSAKTAEQQSYQLLQKTSVKAAIQEEMNKRAARTEITADRVLKEIGKLAFFDPRKMLNADGSPKPINELDDETAACIAGIEVVTKGNEVHGFADVLKVKLTDKARSLELLGRHLKMFTDKIEVDMSDELATRLKAARERAKNR